MTWTLARRGLDAARSLAGGACLLLTGRDPRMPRIARRSGRRPVRRPPDAPVRKARPRQGVASDDPPSRY